ncbi:hypothetical protein [Evansella cellulosilytica]|uniref:Uncharacterized protein n=1 Tax=Evansella cellulosilytica (strain ATCC 21833 / DSM 2522 / FERM P-1141 / JCM 9156 / N-4) TaxID=649639 RepID=E6TVK6_EVAC2|nr:hypothetical protein [Evansella cellulosilytica]ADU32134.1 hypothetical protein Bcell_3895 [Evansella cellulosilytica DSM 2522]
MIDRDDQYQKSFSCNKKIREEALRQALDIRKFEIELYWKRATYFWTFLAATFAGYFLVHSIDSPPQLLIFIICNLGFMFSLSWFLVNKGSKFWQNNWERHVDRLEDTEMGPLYKTVIMKEGLSKWSSIEEFPFSVSKINQILSLYITLLWLILLLNSIGELLEFSISEGSISINMKLLPLIITILTIYFIYLFIKKGVSNIKKREEKVEIKKRETERNI